MSEIHRRIESAAERDDDENPHHSGFAHVSSKRRATAGMITSPPIAINVHHTMMIAEPRT